MGGFINSLFKKKLDMWSGRVKQRKERRDGLFDFFIFFYKKKTLQVLA